MDNFTNYISSSLTGLFVSLLWNENDFKLTNGKTQLHLKAGIKTWHITKYVKKKLQRTESPAGISLAFEIG